MVALRIGRTVAILIAAPVALALATYAAAYLAARNRGLVRILAQAVTVIPAALTGALVGFLIPLAPLANRVIGTTFWAGILATLGTIAGMSLADKLLARLDKRR